MKRIAIALLFIPLIGGLSSAEETSFMRIKVPDAKGHQTKAVLTFSDTDKAMEVRPKKGDVVSIPFAQIDTFSYEYTRKHRIKQGVMIGVVSPAAGVIVAITKSRSHWLEVDYHDRDIPKAYVVRMDKHEYLRILDAVQTHTGKDAEILGNADKRR